MKEVRDAGGGGEGVFGGEEGGEDLEEIKGGGKGVEGGGGGYFLEGKGDGVLEG